MAESPLPPPCPRNPCQNHPGAPQRSSVAWRGCASKISNAALIGSWDVAHGFHTMCRKLVLLPRRSSKGAGTLAPSTTHWPPRGSSWHTMSNHGAPAHMHGGRCYRCLRKKKIPPPTISLRDSTPAPPHLQCWKLRTNSEVRADGIFFRTVRGMVASLNIECRGSMGGGQERTELTRW